MRFLSSILLLTCLFIASPNFAKTAKLRPGLLLIKLRAEDASGRRPYDIAKQLFAAGFNLNYLDLTRKQKSGMEKLHKLLPHTNVIALLGTGESQPNGSLLPWKQKLSGEILQFAQNGGGVIYIAMDRIEENFAAAHSFLKPWGIGYGCEPVFNNNYVANQTPYGLDFAETNNIAPSPVSKGIKRIWYATHQQYNSPNVQRRMRKSGIWNTPGGMNMHETLTASFSPQWTIVVRGGKGSYSKVMRTTSEFLNKAYKTNGYPAAPPIFAIRNYGKGRLAFCGIQAPYLIYDAALRTLAGITWSKGLNGKKSDTGKLIINTLKWLAAPSLESGRHGFPNDPQLLKNPASMPILPPSQVYRHILKGRWRRMNSLPGIIGARTNYSTGNGTVKEWRNAAVKAGLRFLFFIEDFTALTPQKLEKLKSECKKLSDGKILLLPGFSIENYIGMKTYFIGQHILYPNKKMLAPDGKRFGNGVAYANRGWRGQLQQLRMAYLYQKIGRRAMSGYYDFNNLPVDPSGIGTYDSIPVDVWRNGKNDWSGLPVYFKAAQDVQYPLPVAIAFLDDPSQLADKNLPRTWAAFDKLDDFAQWMKIRFNERNPLTGQLWVSDGPKILSWDRRGGKDYDMRNRDGFVWQNAICAVHLEVASDVPLREVRVWDGARPFRTFRPKNKKFSATILLDKRHHQHALSLEVIDSQGRRAVSSSYRTQNHLMQQKNISDRNNQKATGFIRRKDGTMLSVYDLKATPDKRVGFMQAEPAKVFTRKDYYFGTGAFDGHPRNMNHPIVFEALRLNIKEAKNKYTWRHFQSSWGAEENCSPHVATNVSSSMDRLIGLREVNNVFADKIEVAHVWFTLWNTVPRKFSTWKQTRSVLRPRPEQPLIFWIWDYELTLKQDVRYSKGSLGIYGPELDLRGAETWSIGPAGEDLQPVKTGKTGIGKTKGVKLPFGPGAWVSCYGKNSGGAIIFSLTPGMRIISSGNPARPRFIVGFPANNAPKKAGEKIKFSLLIAGIPRLVDGYSDKVASKQPGQTAAAIKQSLGIGCKPAYRVKWERGTPVPSDFFCKVKAADGEAAGEFFRTNNLIAPVAVLVCGLNPNWTCVLLELDKKQSRPLDVIGNKALTVVDPKERKLDLFIGHPVQADNSALIIHCVQAGENRWHVEVHNPTDKPISTKLKTASDWKIFKLNKKIELAPGSSKTIQTGNLN